MQKDMGYYVPVTPSLDSGLGASFTIEDHFRPQIEKIPIKASLVTEEANAFGMHFQQHIGSVSKSWSDWVIEDEEEEERERAEREKELKRRSWSYESDHGYADDDGYDVEWVGGGWEDLAV